MSNWVKFRTLILAALVTVLLTGTVYAAVPVIKDVPQNHWAYDAVSKLVSKGYLSINTLGEFQGNQPVDRYNLAQALGRLLDDIESGKVRVASEDVELLRKLTNEYREELVKYYAEQQKTAASLTEAVKRISVLDEKINAAIVALDDITIRSESLQRSISDAEATQAAQTTALQHDLANLQLQLANSIGQLQKEAEELKLSLRNTEESLRSETQALVSGINASQDQKRAALESKTASVEIRVTDLEKRIDNVESKSYTLDNQLKAQSEQLNSQISNSTTVLRSEIEALRVQAAQERNAAIGNLETKLQEQIDKLNQAQTALQATQDAHNKRIASLEEYNKQQDAAFDSKLAAERIAWDAAFAALDAKQAGENDALAAQLKADIQNVASESIARDNALQKQFTDSLAAQSSRIDAETAARQAAVQELDQKLAAQTAQLAAEVVAKFEKMEAEGALSEQALLHKMQTELESQKAQIDAERSARESAIQALTNQVHANIDKVAKESADRDTALQNELNDKLALQSSRLDNETAARTQAIKDLQSAIAEQSNRITAETAAREAAVQELDKKLADQTAQLAAEVVAKFEQMETEGALSDQALLHKMQTELDNQQAQIDAERKERETAVQALDAKQTAENTALANQLQANIDKVAQENTARYEMLQKGLAEQSSRIDAEISAREAAVQELVQKLAAQTAQLAAEVVARFEQMESEGQLSEQALLNKMQTELDSQKAQIAAERDAREAAHKALDTKLTEGLADVSQQLTAKIDTLAAESMKRDQEQDDKHQADTERLTSLINAEATARQNAINSLDAKFTQQTNDLALKLATQFDTLSKESADSSAAILHQLQSELGKQQEQIVAEQTARERELQALSSEMKAADAAIETALEERFSLTEKELNQHSESLAAQQLALSELEERFMAALKAQEEAYQQQLAALQTELEQTRQELATMQTKLLMVESRLGLSDTQLEALDRRINEKVDQYITARYMNQTQMEQQIEDLQLKLKLNEEQTKKELGKANTMSWVKAVMATLIGVFVTPW